MAHTNSKRTLAKERVIRFKFLGHNYYDGGLKRVSDTAKNLKAMKKTRFNFKGKVIYKEQPFTSHSTNKRTKKRRFFTVMLTNESREYAHQRRRRQR